MSNPDNTATQKESNSSDKAQEELPSLEEQLAISEKRRKDTQAGYTKGQQALKAKEAQIAMLTEQLENNTAISISAEDQKELDDMKFSDPVAWREKLNALETKHRGESRAKLAELSKEASGAAEQSFELERRAQVLKEHNESNEIAITDEVIANDIPPRITSKLANGEITFEEFLVETTNYLETGKIVKNEKTLGQPNMGNMAGGKTPSDTKPEESLSKNYSDDLY